MNEERAKKVLQEQIEKYGQEYDAEGIESLEMAIKALEQQPCEDCVSREALKERFRWLEKATKYDNKDAEQQHFSYSTMMMYEIKDEIDNVIDSLPSVQPQSLEQIKWERDTAINQLEQLGYGLGAKIEPCDDCVSREAVRRILANQRDELVKLHTVNPKDNPKADAMAYGVNWSLNTLMELPSVTPSYNSIKIELEPCKDCISRQAVLDKKELVELEDGQSFYCINPEDVETLPSVKPQRPQGKWIEQNDTSKHHFGWYYCSNCGAYLMSADGANYCSCCGAEMEDSND